MSNSFYKIEPETVHIWKINLAENFSHLEKLRQILSIEEIQKSEAFHFANDRQNYTVSHGFLRLILAKYLERKPESLCFDPNEFGKPFLKDSPLKFNLSHSGEFALIGVAEKREVGVDIELVRENVNYHELAAQFFSKKETDFFISLPQSDRKQVFFRIWSRKESFVKARGCGLSANLQSFDVLSSATAENQLFTVYFHDSAKEVWSGQDLIFSPNYAAAVVFETETFKSILFDFNSSTQKSLLLSGM